MPPFDCPALWCSTDTLLASPQPTFFTSPPIAPIFSPNRAIRSSGQSHSSISYDVTAPYTPHGTLSSFYSQLQDGGPHTTQRCSLLPPLRNNIYHSIRRHQHFLSFFPKISFSKFFGPFPGAPGAFTPHFRIPLLPLHIPQNFPDFRPQFALPSSRYCQTA